MRRQSWLIILLSVLVLLKGSGLYAMVHCQTMPQSLHSTINIDITAETTTASHNPVRCHDNVTADQVSPLQIAQDQHSASTCQTCDHCCTIHAMAFPATLVLSHQDSPDKVQQFTYFHSSAFIPAQKRPPKFA